MREYHIYMQRTKVVEYHCEWANINGYHGNISDI